MTAANIEYDHQGYPRKPMPHQPWLSWFDGQLWYGHRENGQFVAERLATEQDREDCYQGRGVRIDETNCPTRKAWADHVAAGGD